MTTHSTVEEQGTRETGKDTEDLSHIWMQEAGERGHQMKETLQLAHYSNSQERKMETEMEMNRAGDLWIVEMQPARAEERGSEKLSFIYCAYVRFEWIDRGTS